MVSRTVKNIHIFLSYRGEGFPNQQEGVWALKKGVKWGEIMGAKEGERRSKRGQMK